MRQALRGMALETFPSAKWRLWRAFDYAHGRVAAFRLQPQRDETVGQDSPLRGAIEDFPVAQLSAAAERNRSGANSA